MHQAKAGRIILPLLPAIVTIVILYINAAVTYSSIPGIKGGVLDLSGIEMKNTAPFHLAGEWEFYWGKLMGDAEIESGGEDFLLVEAPGIWNDLEIDGQSLPGFGQATYRARVTGAPAGERMAVRIQNMASAYRLFIDGNLIASNGSFGDKANAHVSQYRPQYAEFTTDKDSYNIILQVTNDAYAVGGMWDPVMFGLAESMAGVNGAVKIFDYVSIGSIIAMCLFFLIMFSVIRREKEMLILCGMGLVVLLRLLESGDAIVAYILPDMPIAGFGWIDYLTGAWVQFFLLCFVYTVYASPAGKRLSRALLIYTVCLSVFILLGPFEIVAGSYMIMNFIQLVILAAIVVYTARMAMKGRAGARGLLAAISFILFFPLYEFFVTDLSVVYFLINGWALDFTILFLVQCAIVARRYKEARRLELGLLKTQIRPHFVHNALATIISISRKDAEYARELLQDFSSYLRGCYDYEGDDLIPLEQELDFVRAYAALEQARFGDKLRVEYRIEVENIVLPPLILQPLVENTFVHGLREKEEGGTVIVYAVRCKWNMVRIGVRDDGVGLNNNTGIASERRGIGIGNINRRLARLYQTQLHFLVPAGGGCEVYMEIPHKEVLP